MEPQSRANWIIPREHREHQVPVSLTRWACWVLHSRRMNLKPVARASGLKLTQLTLPRSDSPHVTGLYLCQIHHPASSLVL